MPSHNLLCQGTSGVEANGINALFQEKDDCCIHVEMKLLYPANLHGFGLIQTRGGVHFYHFCPAIVGKAHVMIESVKLLFGLSANWQSANGTCGFSHPEIENSENGRVW